MRWLAKLSRIAFVCNVCFVLAFSISITNWIRNKEIESTIIIIGYFLSIIFNAIVITSYLILLLFRKKIWQVVPVWLITANVMFLVMQVFFILYLNDH